MRQPDQRSERGGDGLPPAAVATIAICTLAYLLDGVVHTVMGPLAPIVARSLHLSIAQLGPLFSANLIGQCIGLIAFPLAVGRIGHRGVVIGTLAGFGLFQMLCGLAQSGEQLFWLRLVTGFFLGGTLPSCLAMIAEAAPPHRRGFIISLMFVGYGTGCALAGIAALPGDWRMVMAGIGAVCLFAAAISWHFLVEPRQADAASSEPVPPPLRGALLLLAPPFGLGTVMLWLLFIAMLTISYCLSSWLPTMLVQVGRSASFASLSVTVFGLGGIVAGLVVGALMDRFGQIRVLVGCFLGATVLFVWIGQVLATATPVFLMTLLVADGFCALGAYAGINVVLAGFYPVHLRALGIGVTKSVGRVGTVLAPILIGLALTNQVAETTVTSLFAVPTALCVAALLVIANARRVTTRRENETGKRAGTEPARLQTADRTGSGL